MKNIWIISDTHLNHGNILKFTDDKGELIRNFSSKEEMNELIIDNWNKTVGDNDIVYHLGDVFFGGWSEGEKLLARLKGKKRLILGNHDILEKKWKTVYNTHFEKIMVWRMFSDPAHRILCSHVPVEKSSFFYKNLRNVHGHLHQNLVLNDDGTPNPWYLNVCVEHTNYTPLHIDEVSRKIWSQE